MRPSRIDVDLAPVAHNVAALTALVAPAEVCVVVKGDGYGHGAVAVGRVALGAGATWLAVALLEEGAVLRAAGIDAPILMLSEPGLDSFDMAVAEAVTPTVYTLAGIEAASAASSRAGRGPFDVHLKVDSGMHRVGADARDAVALAERITADPALRLGGVWTHLATAEVVDEPSNTGQLDRFDEVLSALRAAGIDPGLVHAANSAGTLCHPRSRFDLVRCGLTVYGIAPSPECAGVVDLRPAMRVSSEVAFVRRVEAGEAISYGGRLVLDAPRWIATVPIGYADGVRRALGSTGGEVLVGGRRVPIAGTITMDQLMIDLGDASDVDAGPPAAVGDEVVLLGAQCDERIAADEWATRLGTISYEVVCGFGPRLPRVYSGG